MAVDTRTARLAPPTAACRHLAERLGFYLAPRRLAALARTNAVRSVPLLDGSVAFDVDQLVEDVRALRERGAA